MYTMDLAVHPSRQFSRNLSLLDHDEESWLEHQTNGWEVQDWILCSGESYWSEKVNKRFKKTKQNKMKTELSLRMFTVWK